MATWSGTTQTKPNAPPAIGKVLPGKHTRNNPWRPGQTLALFARARVLTSEFLSGRRERTDRNVISVRIPKRELLSLRVRIHVWLLFEPRDERACPLKRQVEIIDTEEQQEPVAGCSVIRACQRGMLVGAPLVQAEQDSSIRIENLPEVVVGRKCSGLTEQRLVPFEADRHVSYAYDRPYAFHRL